MLELSDSKTEHLPGLLPFVPGMPVILTQNIAIELGLINGVNGIFRQLVYQVDSVSTDNLSEAYPSNTQYIYRPLYALIEIARSKIECNMEELPPKLVPIPLIEQTFRVDISDILPKDKWPRSNQKAILSVKRRALPLVPAYCITTHKSQGQTLSKVVIDLKLPNETDDIAAVYPWDRFFPCCGVTVHIDASVTQLSTSVSQFAYYGQMRRNCGWLCIVVMYCSHNCATVLALRFTACSAITTVPQYPQFTTSVTFETKSNQQWRILIPIAVLVPRFFHFKGLR